MRVYGRTAFDEFGKRRWIVVETDAQGYNDYVHLTALIQCLKLNLGESPFYGNFGIPAHSSVVQQIAPDYAVAFIQKFYSQFFVSLIISKQPMTYPRTPVYNISVIRHDGSTFETEVGM